MKLMKIVKIQKSALKIYRKQSKPTLILNKNQVKKVGAISKKETIFPLRPPKHNQKNLSFQSIRLLLLQNCPSIYFYRILSQLDLQK